MGIWLLGISYVGYVLLDNSGGLVGQPFFMLSPT